MHTDRGKTFSAGNPFPQILVICTIGMAEVKRLLQLVPSSPL